MATSRNHIISILKERNLTWYSHPNGKLLLLPFPFGKENINVYVQLQRTPQAPAARDQRSPRTAEDISAVGLRIPRFLMAGTSNRERLLEKMMEINYRRFGKFSLDPSDNEVVLAVDVPLEDALFTGEQFDRCLSTIMGMATEYRDQLIRINEGVESDQDGDDVDLLAKLLEGFDDDASEPAAADAGEEE